ncbi:MAG: hypothetical protein ACRDRN_06040 [Sciscionella sp.]
MRALAAIAVAILGVVGGTTFWMRDEIRRYIRIVRMDANPGLVGTSITPPGNEAALRK